MIPEFAILGHPNEGKSSVLSTLAEDDSVQISDTPGETRECRTFPVKIDGRELLRFTDTPGFQNPGRVLSELKKRVETKNDPIASFLDYAREVPELHDDRELLGPLSRGAGIIYVVDGSRPLRNVDKAEMEILRLTGKPRMAILNCKEKQERYLADWKKEFRQNFNINRTFNAHRATYAERILLLEALKSIDQDWQDILTKIVDAFKKDWRIRNETTADMILTLLSESIQLRLHENISNSSDKEKKRDKLLQKYTKEISKMEKLTHQRIRTLFKHNIFNYTLPPHSPLHEDVFDEQSWQLLGLTQKQVVIAGGLGGVAIGAGLEAATLGHALGMFTVLGGVVGAVGALWGGKNLTENIEVAGLPLGGETIQIGPTKSIDLLFVLLNRSLLYYQHTINWAHGRRDYEDAKAKEKNNNLPMASSPFTANWSTSKIKICHDFFKALQKEENGKENSRRENFHGLIITTLGEISENEG